MKESVLKKRLDLTDREFKTLTDKLDDVDDIKNELKDIQTKIKD